MRERGDGRGGRGGRLFRRGGRGGGHRGGRGGGFRDGTLRLQKDKDKSHEKMDEELAEYLGPNTAAKEICEKNKIKREAE